jgi:hypothetical protein
MSLAHPLWLWGLLTLPVFFALYRRRERRLKLVIAKLLAPRLRAANSCFSTKPSVSRPLACPWPLFFWH